MLLLPLLLGCNPEHNPSDLAHIEALEAEVTRTNANLVATRSERDEANDQLTVARAELDAFKVVGQAWYAASGQPIGAELVVCYPDEYIPEGVTPLPGTRTQPWVQAAVSSDCGEPMVLSLVVTTEEPATEPLAQAGEGYDGPQLTNAPDDEEDPD